MKLNILVAVALAFSITACNSNSKKEASDILPDNKKIVSLNGSVSEILYSLGLERNVVGTDITSNYPESMKAKPKVGHNKTINAEGVLALQPDLIIAIRKDFTPALATQFKASGVKLLLLDQEFSVNGTKNLIRSLADSLHQSVKGDSIIKSLTEDFQKVKPLDREQIKPRVLFIYARGTGSMMVGGTGTPVEKVVELAGGQNAVTEFADYKPLTAEALVNANPDVILLFNSGLNSLGGTTGLAKVQGIKETNAGKNNKIISMDGELLSSFGPRLGIAVQELATKIK